MHQQQQHAPVPANAYPQGTTPPLPAVPTGYRYSTIIDETDSSGLTTTTLEKVDDLHCVCRQPMADDEECVGCDSCHVWFHPHCVGLAGVPDVDEWYCPACRDSAATGQIYQHSNLKNTKIVRYFNRILQIPKHFSLCDACYQYFYDYSQDPRTSSHTNQPMVQPPKTYCRPCMNDHQNGYANQSTHRYY